MSPALPPELEHFVQQELAARAYGSREELMVDAVRQLHDSKEHLRRLREDVENRVAALDRGEGLELDDQSLKALLFEVATEVQQERA